jgi:hypothetical protein
MLAMTFAVTIFLPNVESASVSIISITPSSHHGKVGDTVSLSGTINNTNGLYQIWFDTLKVEEANATGSIVNATFSVPKLPLGNYTIILNDYSLNANATTWFYIDTAYYIEAKPPMPLESTEQLQEGSTVEIWVNITGGQLNKTYVANITVKVPSNTTYWTLARLTNITDTGEGHNITTVYPTNFSGATYTNYVGTYSVAFNRTLATDTFVIGLTNSTEYHRSQIVDIKAVGYKSNENTTIKISLGEKTLNSTNATATSEGLVNANWTVPSNATIGTYTVNITSISPSPTIKKPPDVQSFDVPGFDVNITTRSLSGETAANVIVSIFENEKFLTNLTSPSTGLIQAKNVFEIGNYTVKAFYKGEKVGELQVNVTEMASLNFTCSLTNLKTSAFAKVNGTEIPIPEVEVYLTSTVENRTSSTNTTGIAIVNLLLPNHTYVLNSSRYGVSFNVTSLPTLLVNGTIVAWYNVTLVTPTFTLQINTTKSNNEPISNAPLKVQEQMGGLHFEGNTNTEGMIVFSSVAFGKYIIEVYDADGIKLNETTVNLFQNQNVSIVCKLYGLTVSFRIVDYFGQPIPNLNVTLQRENLASYSSITQVDGIATFNDITGGSFQISINLLNQIQQAEAKAIYVGDSATIEIKLEEYVILAGFLVNTVILVTIIIIVATILLALLVEVLRRRRFTLQKSSKPEPKLGV